MDHSSLKQEPKWRDEPVLCLYSKQLSKEQMLSSIFSYFVAISLLEKKNSLLNL